MRPVTMKCVGLGMLRLLLGGRLRLKGCTRPKQAALGTVQPVVSIEASDNAEAATRASIHAMHAMRAIHINSHAIQAVHTAHPTRGVCAKVRDHAGVESGEALQDRRELGGVSGCH